MLYVTKLSSRWWYVCVMLWLVVCLVLRFKGSRQMLLRKAGLLFVFECLHFTKDFIQSFQTYMLIQTWLKSGMGSTAHQETLSWVFFFFNYYMILLLIHGIIIVIYNQIITGISLHKSYMILIITHTWNYNWYI